MGNACIPINKSFRACYDKSSTTSNPELRLAGTCFQVRVRRYLFGITSHELLCKGHERIPN